MKKALSILLGVPAAAFVLIGLAWWVAPAQIAPQVGMTKLEGAALSTQIGDLGSFFLVMGVCILIALVKRDRFWFLPALMLISVAATGRIIAWLVHGAALTLDNLAVELPVAALLVLAFRLQDSSRTTPTQGTT
jgi:hypothetical protein